MTQGNEPAYAFTPHSTELDTYGGLTKREYFAAMRKEPLFGDDTMAQSWAETIMGSKVPEGITIENIQWWIEAHERFAVMKADALISALNQNQNI